MLEAVTEVQAYGLKTRDQMSSLAPGYGQKTLTAKSTDQRHCKMLTVGITLQCEPGVLRYQLENKATEWCQMGVLLLTPGLDHGLPQAMQP